MTEQKSRKHFFRTLAREPIVQFIVLGLLIFSIAGWVDNHRQNVVLCTFWVLSTILSAAKAGIQHTAPYFIGAIASFWLIERLLMI